MFHYKFFLRAVTFTLLNKLGRYKSEVGHVLKTAIKSQPYMPWLRREKEESGTRRLHLTLHYRTNPLVHVLGHLETENSLRAKVMTYYSFIFYIDNLQIMTVLLTVKKKKKTLPYIPPKKPILLFLRYVKHVFSQEKSL